MLDLAINLPQDHPQRRVAADEVHARPQDAMSSPERATYLAVMVGPDDRERELAHIASLCAQHRAHPPGAGDRHFSASLGGVRMRWERHTEFSSYTFVVPGLSPRPFSEPAAMFLPAEWLTSIPGQTIVAAHAKLAPTETDAPDLTAIAEYFDGNVPVGAWVGDGAGSAFTDFRMDANGFVRFVVQDRSLTSRQAGRTLQRLFEIEAYRVMALLALPIARRLAPQVAQLERALGTVTDRIAGASGNDEVLLGELTQLAVDVESARNASQMRFGASLAYHDLVRTRIAELRERRLPGVQTIDEFMTRRLTPAMATCSSVSQRLQDLSARVAHASSLLSTRVEIARERQNQALLASMDRRARLQLRLQQTVEWLSIAAVTYYAAGLVGYASKAMKAGGFSVDPDVTVGVAIPFIGIVVAWALHRTRRTITSGSRDPGR